MSNMIHFIWKTVISVKYRLWNSWSQYLCWQVWCSWSCIFSSLCRDSRRNSHRIRTLDYIIRFLKLLLVSCKESVFKYSMSSTRGLLENLRSMKITSILRSMRGLSYTSSWRLKCSTVTLRYSTSDTYRQILISLRSFSCYCQLCLLNR
jgi:hypothetical protein